MDDVSGVFLPCMIEILTNNLENAFAGLELVEELVEFDNEFHMRLYAVLPSDIYSQEAMQRMRTGRELESLFKAFVDVVPFSEILQLRAMNT